MWFAAVLWVALLWAAPVFAASWHFVVFGDMPYRESHREAAQHLITRINQTRPAFSVFVGDFKTGRGPCSDAAFQQAREWLNGLTQPWVYTPGDNEWTDCHRGGADPLERLARLRQIFYQQPHAAPGPAGLTRQTPGYPENAQWRKDGVWFAALHVVGSGNNYEAYGADGGLLVRNDEFPARERANRRWLLKLFQSARAESARAVVLFVHADFFFRNESNAQPGFKHFVTALQGAVRQFAKPVLLFHGDRHRFTVDQPWSEQGIGNFTRIMVDGDQWPQALGINAVDVTVDGEAATLFRFGQLRP